MSSAHLARLWRPAWLRPLAFLCSVGVHGYAVVAIAQSPPQPEAIPVESLEITLAPPEGEAMAEEEQREDSVAQQESVASVAQPEPPPPPPEPDALEKVKVEDAEAEALQAVTKPVEPPPPEEKPEEIKEPEPVAEVKPEAAPQPVTAAAAEESFATRAIGVENGLRHGGGMTRAAYAAVVKKQIAKNRKRPTAQGRGVVSISFSIGREGKVDRTTIVRSVNAALDETARSIIASIHLPPPPDGAFQATIAIKFE
jgi:periplasmic protein TonB